MSESEISMTEFDKKFCDGSAQLIKAAIPYVNGNSARIFTVIAKLLELKKALQCLQSPKPEINICALPGQQHDPEEMLRDLRKYCDPSQAEMIDRIINMMNVGKLYEKYRQLESSPEFSKMMSMVFEYLVMP